jgi:hypothetical protein
MQIGKCRRAVLVPRQAHELAGFPHARAAQPELRSRQHVTPPNRQSGGHPEEAQVGKGILLWLLGIPLPIIIILLLIWH